MMNVHTISTMGEAVMPHKWSPGGGNMLGTGPVLNRTRSQQRKRLSKKRKTSSSSAWTAGSGDPDDDGDDSDDDGDDSDDDDDDDSDGSTCHDDDGDSSGDDDAGGTNWPSGFVTDEFNSLGSYARRKRYFERYVCKVACKGFAVFTKGEGWVLKRAASLQDEFAGLKEQPGSNRSFVKRWKADQRKARVGSVTYAPYHGGRTQMTKNNTLNFFAGYGAGVQQLQTDDVDALIRPWEIIGLQLCENNPAKFELLKQWLAHLVQYPQERSNICFCFVGSKKGVGKNSFFAPIRRILGGHNAFETSDIHRIVPSPMCDTACKLLCVFDEATRRSTKTHHNKLLTTITADVTSSKKPGQLPYTVPSHHRVVILSNNIDGVYIKYDAGVRRFIVSKPTDLLTTLSDAKQTEFFSEYARRFVDCNDNLDYINALYTHLTRINIKYKSAKEWEQAGKEVMHGSPLEASACDPPAWARFLYDFTDPHRWESQQVLKRSKKRGVYRVDGELHELRLTYGALYRLYQGSDFSPIDTETQTKFTQSIRRALVGGLGISSTAGIVPPSPTKKMDSGKRTALVKTDYVHKWLDRRYPLLKHEASQAAALKVLRLNLEEDLTNNTCFC